VKRAAPAFIRALIAANRPKAIALWVPLADPAAIGPLVTVTNAVLGGRFAPDVATVNQAYAALLLRHDDRAAARIAMFEMLTQLFAPDVVPAEFASRIAPAKQGAVPNAVLWLDQENAAASGRLGATILASLVFATDDRDLTREPIALDRALRGLRAVGRDDDARAIALEAAVAAGL
jgi:hypothetical protein